MPKITRKLLKETYEFADENYLVAMVEGKMYIVNYANKKKVEAEKEFDKYLIKIENIFTEYLNKQNRTYFLPDDINMKNKWIKEIKEIISEYIMWSKRLYINTISETYNYKRLYNLWMLSTVYGAYEDTYDKPVGEADEDKKGIVDPGFSNEKLKGLLETKQYGKTYEERLNQAYESGSNIVENNMSGIFTGKGKELNQYYKKLEKDLKKDVSNRVKTAISMGIEGAEDYGDYDVFSNNPFFQGNYQRVEILDKKTCLVCVSIDGQVTKVPLGRIHPNCRGIDVPINSAEDKTKIKEMNSKAKRKENFDNWFNNLEEKDKKSLLGKTKYEKYKEGKINVHDLVKKDRVLGAKEIERMEKLKAIPNINNNMKLARSVLRNEASKLPQKSIPKIKTKEEINAYYRYINKKEQIYKNMDTKELKRNGINRNSLNAEINRERKILRLKEKEISVNTKIKTFK